MKAGLGDKALDMFTSLHQYEEAKTWAREGARTQDEAGALADSLASKQAEWSEEVKDYGAAVDMYMQVWDRLLVELAVVLKW